MRAIPSKYAKYHEEWVRLYESGMSTYGIAKQYSCSRTNITRIIRRRGTIRSVEEQVALKRANNKLPISPYISDHDSWIMMYNNGMTPIEIADQYGCCGTTVSRLITKVGASRSIGEAARLRSKRRADNDPRPQYHFFDKVEIEEKAYMLGLLLADGSVSYKKSAYTVALKLKEEDAYMVDRLANIFGARPVSVTTLLNGREFTGRVCYLHSVYLCNRLIELGIRPRKSATGKADIFDNIPSNLMNHFLRGLIDGDGSIYMESDRSGCAISVYGSYDIVCRVRYEFMKLGVAKNKASKTGNIYQTAWGAKSDVRNILNYLYNDATIYLKRKYLTAQRILNMIGDSNG